MGWAKRVIVLSNVIARHMIEDFAVPHDRIRLVPRSVDLERFKYLDPKLKRKDEFIDIALVILPPKELPKILPCSLKDRQDNA